MCNRFKCELQFMSVCAVCTTEGLIASAADAENHDQMNDVLLTKSLRFEQHSPRTEKYKSFHFENLFDSFFSLLRDLRRMRCSKNGAANWSQFILFCALMHSVWLRLHEPESSTMTLMMKWMRFHSFEPMLFVSGALSTDCGERVYFVWNSN